MTYPIVLHLTCKNILVGFVTPLQMEPTTIFPAVVGRKIEEN